MVFFPSSLRAFAIRLRPGDDLRQSLQDMINTQKMPAAAIVTCVGSLTRASLRMANQRELTTQTGKFEIVSLTGTLSPSGLHLHLAISDKNGKTIGGHLANGNLIYTTAEIVAVELLDLSFARVQDQQTGFRELSIRSRE